MKDQPQKSKKFVVVNQKIHGAEVTVRWGISVELLIICRQKSKLLIQNAIFLDSNREG